MYSYLQSKNWNGSLLSKDYIKSTKAAPFDFLMKIILGCHS